MQKILYFGLSFCFYVGTHTAASSVSQKKDNTYVLKFETAFEKTPLKLFIDGPKDFERIISNKFHTEEACRSQQEIRAIFAEQLKVTPKSDLLKALILTCFNDTRTTAKFVLEAGASVNAYIPELHITPLRLALGKSAALVKILLENGANANQISDKRTMQTPLHDAVHLGDPKLSSRILDNDELATFESEKFKKITLLLEHKADPNIQRFDGATPLYYAAEKGFIEIMKALLAAGAKPNLPNKKGITPFYMAVQEDKTDAARLLWEHGADINQSHFKKKTTPLQRAVYLGHTNSVYFLLQNGADTTFKNSEDITLLYIAAEKGHSTVVEALIEYGANRHARTWSAQTPLFAAVAGNNEACVHALLHTKQKYGISEEIAPQYSSLNHPNIYGYTPLSMAAYNGNAMIFKMLIQAGAVLNAIIILPNNDKHSVISVLANTSADIEGILTVCDQHFDKALWQRLADTQDSDGNYPIHRACANNKLNLLQRFLDNDVHTNVRNAAGKTPYQVAYEADNKAATSMLIKHFVRSAMRNGIIFGDELEPRICS